MPHDRVSAHAVRARLVRSALADHAEAMRVIDVEQRAVCARNPRERCEIRRIAGHAVDAVHADHRRFLVSLRDQLREMLRVLEAEAAHRGPVAACNLAAVIHRLVRARVEEDRPAAGEHRYHRAVDVRDRRQKQRVLAAEQRGQLVLDLLVQHGAAEHARPARVRPPLLERRRNRRDDLGLEIEAEVVARREVGEPAITHADHAPVDLVHDRIHHGVRRAQIGKTLDGLELAIEPTDARSLHAAVFGRFHGSL